MKRGNALFLVPWVSIVKEEEKKKKVSCALLPAAKKCDFTLEQVSKINMLFVISLIIHFFLTTMS